MAKTDLIITPKSLSNMSGFSTPKSLSKPTKIQLGNLYLNVCL